MATTVPISKSEEWSSQSFWRGLAPELHVEDQAFLQAGTQSRFTIDEKGAGQLQRLIRTEGYFQLPPPQWHLPLDTMVALIAKLDGAGIPVPFAFVYDELWLLFLKLHHMIEPLLGKGYMRLPDFWVWFVDPKRGDSGWKPHRDKATTKSLRPDGSPLSLTVWLPLSDATTLNGCMYMVPADRDPTYNTERQGEWTFAHQDVRALPADAGSILMWNQAVLHWGSRGNPRAAAPRVSAAFEFQSGDIAPFNQPLMPPNSVPGFDLRMRLIAKQILQYQHMYPLSTEMSTIAQQLLARPVPQ